MTIRQRLSQAWQGLRADPEPTSEPRALLKARRGAIPSLWPDYRNAQPLWSMTDVQSFVEHGYNINAVIYAACQYRADAIITAQLRAYRGTQDRADALLDADPLARLLRRPNAFQSAHEFHALNSVFFALAGQSYIWFARARSGEVPSAMYTLRPDWVKIVPGKENGQSIIGYVYAPEGMALSSGYPLLPEDVMHVKRPNPGDPIMGAGYGFSPVNALAQSGNVDNDVTKFLKVFFQSGAMFQNVVSFEGEQRPEDLAAVRERLKEIYGGVDNWNEWGVFGSSAKVTRVSPTFDEMGFDAIDARNEARMLMALGVPPVLVGARLGLERSTFSNYEEARRAFWEDRLLPELKMFEGEFQYYLGDDRTFLRYDLSDVPALRKDLTRLTASAYQLWQMGVPPRIAFTTVGLEVEQYDGDEVSLSALRQPAEPALTPGSDEATRNEEEAQLNEQAGAAAKARTVKAYDPAEMALKMDRLAVSWEERFGKTVNKVFEQERREISAMLSELQQDAYRRKGSIRWTSLMGDLVDWYATNQPANWRAAFVPLIEGVMVDTGKEWATALGVQWDIRNLRGEAWFQDYALKFAQPITQTSSDSIHAVLAQAQAEGWSIPETDKRLGQVFEQWMTGALDNGDFEWFEQRLPPYRREMISRTETIRASNAGALNLGKEWGASKKFWMGTIDGRERDTHHEATLTYSRDGAIPMDEDFIVGGVSMNAPGDPRAPVEEVVNCRCTLGLLTD